MYMKKIIAHNSTMIGGATMGENKKKNNKNGSKNNENNKESK